MKSRHLSALGIPLRTNPPGGLAAFLVVVLFCLSPPKAWAQNEEKEIYQTQTVENFAFLGVLSVVLDSLSRDMLAFKVLDLLQKDPDFKIKEANQNVEIINAKYQRSQGSFEFLADFLQDFQNPLLFLSFEKKLNDFICKIFILKSPQSKVQPADSLSFIWDIKNNVRRAAPHVHQAIRSLYGLQTGSPPKKTVFKLKVPIAGALLTDEGKIIEPDSILNIGYGNTLHLGTQAQPYYIRSNNFKYLLFPGLAVTFYSPSLAEIKAGKMGFIQTGFKSTFLTSSLKSEFNSVIGDLEFNGSATTLKVYVGQAKVQPLKGKDSLFLVEGRGVVESNGFQLRQSRLADSALSEELAAFKPLLNSQIVSHFKSAQTILDIVPSSDIQFYYSDVTDPMDYFIAQEIGDLGIPGGALLFEGENWDVPSILIRKGVHESGCYLCRPNRAGHR